MNICIYPYLYMQILKEKIRAAIIPIGNTIYEHLLIEVKIIYLCKKTWAWGEALLLVFNSLSIFSLDLENSSSRIIDIVRSDVALDKTSFIKHISFDKQEMSFIVTTWRLPHIPFVHCVFWNSVFASVSCSWSPLILKEENREGQSKETTWQLPNKKNVIIFKSAFIPLFPVLQG